MAYVLHRTPCCRSKWELKHGKGGGGEKKDPFFMKITYLGDGENPVNFLLKKVNAFGNTYDLDESSINKMTLDGTEIKFEDLTLANKGEYGGTYDVYQYNFGDNSEHELIIYSDSLDTLRFSPWYGGPPPSPSNYFKNITKIKISNSVTNIGVCAFCYCTNLPLITIPNSILAIEQSAFVNCSSLEKVIVEDIAAWCNISFNSRDANPLVFTHHLYSDENTEITDLVIPNSVTSIGGYAFYKCSGLTSVTIPNSVTSIGSSAFQECTSLTSITISKGVTSIGSSAFYGCSGLINVTIPNSVTSIDNNAFYGCTSLTSITIPDSITSISDSAFSGCSGLTSITIPNSVTSIADNAFSRCSSLTLITIPNSVTNIGSNAFSTNNLTSILIPESLTSIGYACFINCSNLESVTVLSTTPPSMTGGSYYGGIFNNTSANLVIYVPVGSVDAYKAATGWSTYADRIQAIQN